MYDTHYWLVGIIFFSSVILLLEILSENQRGMNNDSRIKWIYTHASLISKGPTYYVYLNNLLEYSKLKKKSK